MAFFAVGGYAFMAAGATNAVVAPVDGADGPALRAGDYTIVAMGKGQQWAIAGAGTATEVWAYLVEDFSDYAV